MNNTQGGNSFMGMQLANMGTSHAKNRWRSLMREIYNFSFYNFIFRNKFLE